METKHAISSADSTILTRTILRILCTLCLLGIMGLSISSIPQEEACAVNGDELPVVSAQPATSENEILFSTQAVAGATTYTFDNFTSYQTDSRSMLTAINQFRASNAWYWNSNNTTKSYAGILPALAIDKKLEEAAIQRAMECAVRFAHTRPNGQSCFVVYNEVGATGLTNYGENIAANYPNAASAFDGWKEENENYSGQGHRRNMLGDYNAIGIACVAVDGVKFWAMELGKASAITTPGQAQDSKTDATIEILDSAVSSVSVQASPSSISVAPGASVNVPSASMTCTVTRRDDSEGSWNWANRTFKKTLAPTWTSKDVSIASIQGSTVKGVKLGNTSITCTASGRTCTVPVTVTDKPIVQTQVMYRLYNSNSGEHFYTADANERNFLVRVGWDYEGLAWNAPKKSNSPVYRLYSGTDHHYTLDANERDFLVMIGWSYEGIGWYSDDAKSVPLYREYNPFVNPSAPRNNAGSHNYTTSLAEHNFLCANGWQGEGVGWYGCN